MRTIGHGRSMPLFSLWPYGQYRPISDPTVTLRKENYTAKTLGAGSGIYSNERINHKFLNYMFFYN